MPSHGFESIWVSEIVGYASCNDTESVIGFIDTHSDEQLIKVRADLKEYIGKYSSMSNLWSLLSMYVAIMVVAFPNLYAKLSNLYVDYISFWVAIFIVPIIIGFLMFTRPHRIGKYHRALSMLEDYCKKMGRLQ